MKDLKMNKLYLVLDCNFICHKLKHSMGALKYGEKPTGVIYGFLKQIPFLQDMFNTDSIIFCWDSKSSKRKEIFPGYKAKRANKYKELTPEEYEFEQEFRRQMKKLRRNYLPEIGYKNVFVQKGYEGDDIIASVCKNLPRDDEAIIITSDQDMYQLLSPRVRMYNGTSYPLVTAKSFKKKYGIYPKQWIDVKTLAGCSTDEVPGIKGVGEITAIKYILGTLKETTKVYKRIKDEALEQSLLVRSLVCIPFAGTKVFKLRDDKISKEGWKKVCKMLGMNSIKDKAPIRNVRHAIKKKKSRRKLL